MEKVAIIRRNGLGDLLCSYPLVLYIKQHFPQAHITLFVDHKNYPLVRYLPAVHQVVVLPNRGNKYLNLFRTACKYRSSGFDLAISAKTSPMKLMNFFLFCLGGKKRIAYVDHSWHSRLVNRPILYDEQKAKQMHQALKSLHTIAPHLQEVPEELYPKIAIADAVLERYEGLVDGSLPLLLLSASTTRDASRLDPERYASVVNHLYDSTPFTAVIMGEKKDQERAEAIGRKLKMDCYLYFPRSFEEFMVLLDLCDLYFIGDGGMAHIGAALGKSGVILYGETSPVEWGPLSSSMSTLFHPEHVDAISEDSMIEALHHHWKQKNLEKKRCGLDKIPGSRRRWAPHPSGVSNSKR